MIRLFLSGIVASGEAVTLIILSLITCKRTAPVLPDTLVFGYTKTPSAVFTKVLVADCCAAAKLKDAIKPRTKKENLLFFIDIV